MPTSHESTRSEELIELREWYLESLLPKLARAADTGIIEPAGAVELERRFSELLGPPRTRADAA